MRRSLQMALWSRHEPTFQNLPPIADGGAAVITCAASGIGLAAARRFAGLGLSVVLADQPGEKLRAAEISIREAGGRAARIRPLTPPHLGSIAVGLRSGGVSRP